jgi:hypothetical protein
LLCKSGAIETFISFCGFAGSWLLVAGSLYQAALELKEEGIDHENLNVVRNALPPPDPVSA